MWKDRGVPVLTIELKDQKILSDWAEVDQLQDVLGTLALRAHSVLSKEKPQRPPSLTLQEEGPGKKSGI